MSINGMRMGGNYQPPKKPGDDATAALGCAFAVALVGMVGYSIWLFFS